MTMSSCKIDLGGKHFVHIVDRSGELNVDLLKREKGTPMEKGITLTPQRWAWLRINIEYIEFALKNREHHELHLGGNTFCKVQNDSVDIRQYCKQGRKLVPTEKGTCLKADQLARLINSLPYIRVAVPKLSSVVPCMFQSDHLTDEGTLQCQECSPNN